MSNNYLCIGSSNAGLAAASKLRQLEPDARITVLTAEKEMPYNRCSLADHLAGERTLDQIRTKKELFFIENNIALLRDARVVELDIKNQRVQTHHDQSYAYDKLFLGIGKSAWRPSIPGDYAQGIFNFYDLDDVLAINAFIAKNQVKNCVVIGAGVTGLEAADALQKKGLSVSLVQRSPQILSQQIDSTASLLLEQAMLDKQVILYKGAVVSEICVYRDMVAGMVLHDGTKIATEMIIFSTGSKPNTNFITTESIAMQHLLISVNQYMQSSVNTIYAGGDAVLVKNMVTGEFEGNSLWSDAAHQGFAAAYNMTGRETLYQGIVPITHTEIFATKIAFVGNIKAPLVGSENRIKQTEHMYHRFILHQGRLKGFVMLGEVLPLGTFKQALLNDALV